MNFSDLVGSNPKKCIFFVADAIDDGEFAAATRREAIIAFLSKTGNQDIDPDASLEAIEQRYGLIVQEFDLVEAGVPVKFWDFSGPVSVGSVDIIVTDRNYWIFEEEQPGSWRVVLKYHHPEEPEGRHFGGCHLDGEVAREAWEGIVSRYMKTRHPSREEAIGAGESYAAAIRAMTDMSEGSEPRGLVFQRLVRAEG